MLSAETIAKTLIAVALLILWSNLWAWYSANHPLTKMVAAFIFALVLVTWSWFYWVW